MKSNQEGFSLVEVLVALVLMAIIVTSLGGLTFATARQAVWADNAMTRQAASVEAVNRFTSLPYAQLAASAGCEDVGRPNNLYRRCVTVTPVGNALRVNIETTPLQRGIPASVVTIMRNAPPPPNPLCTTGC